MLHSIRVKAVTGLIGCLLASAPAASAASSHVTTHKPSVGFARYEKSLGSASKEVVQAKVGNGRGRSVQLQSQVRGRWTTLTSTRVPASGKATLSHRFAAGSYHLRLVLPKLGRSPAVASSVVVIKVVKSVTKPAAVQTALLAQQTVVSGSFTDQDDSFFVDNAVRPHSSELHCSDGGGYDVTVALNARWKSLVTTFDHPEPSGYGHEPTYVEILADGRLLFRQEILTDTVSPLNLDVSGVRQLTFRTTCLAENSSSTVLVTPMLSTAPSTHPSTHTGPTLTWLDSLTSSTVGGQMTGGVLNMANETQVFGDSSEWVDRSCSTPTSSDWLLGGHYQRLTAVVGLMDYDINAPGDGNADSGSLTIVADGRPLGTYTAGISDAIPVDLDLTGVQHLTVQVACGADIVLGDPRLLNGGDLAPSEVSLRPTYL